MAIEKRSFYQVRLLFVKAAIIFGYVFKIKTENYSWVGTFLFKLSDIKADKS